MATKFEVQTVFTVSGAGSLAAAFKDIESSASNLKGKFSDFGSAVGDSIKKIVELGAAAVTAGAAIVALAESNAHAGEEIAKLSEITGVSTDKLQELTYAGSQLGINQEELGVSFKKFSVQLGQLSLAQKGHQAIVKEEAAAIAKAAKEQEKEAAAVAKAAASHDKAIASLVAHTNSLNTHATAIKKGHAALTAMTKVQINNNKETTRANEINAKYNAALAKVTGAHVDLTKALGDTSEGVGTLFKFLDKTNPALLRQLQGAKDTGAAFDILIKAMRKMNSETDRNALAVAAFGKGNINLSQFARLSASDLQKLSEQAHTLGIVLDKDLLEKDKEFVQVSAALHQTLSGLSQELTGALLPGLIEGTKELTLFIGNNRERLIDLVRGAVERLTAVFIDLFRLFDSKGAADNVDETALKIYTSFEKVKETVVSVYTEAHKLYDAFNELTTAQTGFTAQQIITGVAVLKFLGLIDVAVAGLKVFIALWPVLSSVSVTSLRLIAATTELFLSPGGVLLLSIAAVGLAIDFVVQKFGGWKAAWEGFKTIAEFVGNELITLWPRVGLSIVNAFTEATRTIETFFNKLTLDYKALVGLLSHPIETAKVLFSGPASATNAQQHASGGFVSGPGSSTSDSIPARLSDGEYVVNARAVRAVGVDFLNALNGLKGYAAGGLASIGSALSVPSMPSWAGAASERSGGRPLTLVLPNGQSVQTKGVSEDVARMLEKQLRNSANAKATSLPGWY